jgi:segregation and condensation protein A
VTVAALELDLEVFSGPFDLLLTLVLREEIDLLELELADVVLSYLDHLDSTGQLDLEAATEFIVLVAALLELKSRLMLAGEEDELLDLEPAEAADELLERMLAARRYRHAAAHLGERLEAEEGYRYRGAPLPAELRRSPLDGARAVYSSDRLGEALGGLLRTPPTIDLRHLTVPRASLPECLARLRRLLSSRDSLAFDEAVRGADRVTVAVTLFALLELHRRGEASWEQAEPFGEITVRGAGRAAGAGGDRAAQAGGDGAAQAGESRPARTAGGRAAGAGGG